MVHAIDMVDVSPPPDFRDVTNRRSQEVIVALRMTPPRLGPLLETLQLDPENRALDGVHPVVEGVHVMIVLTLLTPVPEQSHCARVGVVVGGGEAALTIGAEILAGIEAEAAEMPNAADTSVLVL